MNISPRTISIITPSFNQAQFLEKNIKSVIDQHYPSVEHIVIDGGSTDGTIDILKKYPHLRWVSEPDRGQTHALNKGFRMATGEIIGWINSDDGYCPGALKEISQCFDREQVSVVYGDGVEVDRDDKTIRPIIPRGISTRELIEYWKWRYEYIQASFFFRKNVFETVGYLDEDLYYTMDHDFLIRLSRKYSFTYVPKPLAYYRMHETSKTGATHQSIIPKYVWELHRVSKKYWGKPFEWTYYRFLGSFVCGILFSVMKNVFFVPGSKSRMLTQRLRKS